MRLRAAFLDIGVAGEQPGPQLAIPGVLDLMSYSKTSAVQVAIGKRRRPRP